MPPSASQLEEQRRFNAKIAKAKAKHMSNAKWLALFTALRNANVGQVRWKFVRDVRVFVQPVPSPAELERDRLGDVLPSPYALFKDIEWLEVPREQATVFASLLTAQPKLPWEASVTGMRVRAYEW